MVNSITSLSTTGRYWEFWFMFVLLSLDHSCANPVDLYTTTPIQKPLCVFWTAPSSTQLSPHHQVLITSCCYCYLFSISTLDLWINCMGTFHVTFAEDGKILPSIYQGWRKPQSVKCHLHSLALYPAGVSHQPLPTNAGCKPPAFTHSPIYPGVAAEYRGQSVNGKEGLK